MIFCKNKRYPGFILIFTLFSLALLSMIFIYRLEDRTHREKFYSLAMKAGGFLDVKKNGKDLEVDVRGLLDLERWSMLNYLRACFYNLATDPRTYMWYLEDNPYKGITDDSVILFLFTRYGTGFCAGTKTDKYYYHHFLGRYKNACTFEKMKFEEIENVVKRYLLWPLPMNYSGAVKSAKSVKTGGIVHNSHLKVEAKIGLADNKLPFNKKFKKEALNARYECIETAYPYKDYKGIVNEGAKKNLGSWKINGITYFNDKAAEIMNQVGNLIEDYEKKCPGYTLTFSDLMSISELRLLILGNFEDEVLQECKWAKDNFKEENA